MSIFDEDTDLETAFNNTDEPAPTAPIEYKNVLTGKSEKRLSTYPLGEHPLFLAVIHTFKDMTKDWTESKRSFKHAVSRLKPMEDGDIEKLKVKMRALQVKDLILLYHLLTRPNTMFDNVKEHLSLLSVPLGITMKLSITPLNYILNGDSFSMVMYGTKYPNLSYLNQSSSYIPILIPVAVAAAKVMSEKMWKDLGYTKLEQVLELIVQEVGLLISDRMETSVGIVAYQLSNNLDRESWEALQKAWGGMGKMEQLLWIACAEAMPLKEMEMSLPSVHPQYKEAWKALIRTTKEERVSIFNNAKKKSDISAYKAQILKGMAIPPTDEKFIELLPYKPEWNACLTSRASAYRPLMSFLKSNAVYNPNEKIANAFARLEAMLNKIVGRGFFSSFLYTPASLQISIGLMFTQNNVTAARCRLPVLGDIVNLQLDSKISGNYDVENVTVNTRCLSGPQDILSLVTDDAKNGFAAKYNGRFEPSSYKLIAGKEEFTVKVVNKKLTKLEEITTEINNLNDELKKSDPCLDMCNSLAPEVCDAVPGCQVEKSWIMGSRCKPGQMVSNHAQKRLTISRTHKEKLQEIMGDLIVTGTSRGFRFAANLENIISSS